MLLDHGGQVVPAWTSWLTPLVGVAMFALAYLVWTRAITRYQGAGG